MNAGPRLNPGDLLLQRYLVMEQSEETALWVAYRAVDQQGTQGPAPDSPWREPDTIVKLVRPELAHDEPSRSYVLRELLRVRPLQHPGLLRPAEIHLLEEHQALVLLEPMQAGLSQGTLLKKVAGFRLRERDPYPLDEARQIGVQLAAVLSYLHGNGVCHGDLRAESVRMRPDGAKLVDVGLGRALPRGPYLDAVRQAGELDLLAKEVREGRPPDARSDVYGLAMLYRFLLSLGDAALWDAFQVSQPALGAVLVRALQDDPEQRYPSVEALVADVEAVALTGATVRRRRHSQTPLAMAVAAGRLPMEELDRPVEELVPEGRRRRSSGLFETNAVLMPLSTSPSGRMSLGTIPPAVARSASNPPGAPRSAASSPASAPRSVASNPPAAPNPPAAAARGESKPVAASSGEAAQRPRRKSMELPAAQPNRQDSQPHGQRSGRAAEAGAAAPQAASVRTQPTPESAADIGAQSTQAYDRMDPAQLGLSLLQSPAPAGSPARPAEKEPASPGSRLRPAAPPQPAAAQQPSPEPEYDNTIEQARMDPAELWGLSTSVQETVRRRADESRQRLKTPIDPGDMPTAAVDLMSERDLLDTPLEKQGPRAALSKHTPDQQSVEFREMPPLMPAPALPGTTPGEVWEPLVPRSGQAAQEQSADPSDPPTTRRPTPLATPVQHPAPVRVSGNAHSVPVRPASGPVVLQGDRSLALRPGPTVKTSQSNASTRMTLPPPSRIAVIGALMLAGLVGALAALLVASLLKLGNHGTRQQPALPAQQPAQPAPQQGQPAQPAPQQGQPAQQQGQPASKATPPQATKPPPLQAPRPDREARSAAVIEPVQTAGVPAKAQVAPAEAPPAVQKQPHAAAGTRGACPAGMVSVEGAAGFCVDKYEFPGAGQVPRTGVSASEASAQCQKRGARLCTDEEWEQACRGRGHASYPYGHEPRPEVCNTSGGALVPAGARSKCSSAVGALDMAGNAAEWVHGAVVRGGSAQGDSDGRCSKHLRSPPGGKSPFVGFRCCAGL